MRLVAWLLYVARHAGGVWPLYRSLLPSTHASLMHFEPSERAELQCAELEALAEKVRLLSGRGGGVPSWHGRVIDAGAAATSPALHLV